MLGQLVDSDYLLDFDIFHVREGFIFALASV